LFQLDLVAADADRGLVGPADPDGVALAHAAAHNPLARLEDPANEIGVALLGDDHDTAVGTLERLALAGIVAGDFDVLGLRSQWWLLLRTLRGEKGGEDEKLG